MTVGGVISHHHLTRRFFPGNPTDAESVSMFDRIPKRPGIPAVALAGGVMFACIPLTPAMGLIGVPEAPASDVAAADAQTAAVADYRSPVVVMAAAEEQREVLAAQQAKQRALELKQAQKQAALLASADGGGSLTFGNDTTTPSVSNGGAIPTTDATPKTRQIQSLIRKYFPRDQLGNAMAVSACESGHSDAKGAVNSDGTIDWGVFQLNDGGTLQASLDAIGVSYSSTAEARQLALETDTNVKAAAQIYAERGWAPWVCAYKIGVVAGLYSNTPGPMDGKFDAWGKPTVSVPVITVDPGADNEPAPQPTPKPDKTKTPKPDPDPTKTAKPEPTPTRTPTPRPSQSSTPKPSQSSAPATVSPKPVTSGTPR